MTGKKATKKAVVKKKAFKKAAAKKKVPVSRSVRKVVTRVPVVGIGASAGGLDAFKQLLVSMPVDTGMAFVLIQHLDPTHESMMVELLARHTEMKVLQVEDGMTVLPNHVYMIPVNKDMAIYDNIFSLTAPSLPRGMRMPIDFFLHSLAADKQELAMCIILSGTGSDGTLGLKSIKSYGGMAMVQKPNDAQYDGMPKSAISTGIVDYILPVSELSHALIKYAQHSYVRGFFGTEPAEIDFENNGLFNILSILNTQLGHNFHHYKKNTLLRRIKRRMSLKQLTSMDKYASYLRENKKETNELFKDMLIGVTSFFREPESWLDLEKNVIKKISKNIENESPFRVWVPGCASGEESYTITMLLLDNLPERNQRDLQVFATDIDKNALEIARTGRYPESIAKDVSPERIDKYFKKEDGFYQINSLVRDCIVFSEQNLISDPPFSKLDLIICRNLLIYLESDIQSKVFELCHFSLNRGGHLMLGNSETIGQHYDLFETISKKWRIFSKISSAQNHKTTFPIVSNNRKWDRFSPATLHRGKKLSVVKSADVVQHLLMGEYAPASVLINFKHQIQYHYGETVNYLNYPTGEPTDDLFAVVREGMITRLRGAVHKAIREGKKTIVTGARVRRNNKYLPITITIRPLSMVSGGEGLLLVSFTDEIKTGNENKIITGNELDDDPVIKQLESELSATKEDLHNAIEELETSNEELKASNEEVMSMNEELQSANEELETSKEELQSLNEELNTVNNELHEKISALEVTNNDLSNLIKNSNSAAIFLDNNKCIHFFTPSSRSLFNLITADLGRAITDIVPKFNDQDLFDDIDEVLNTLHSSNKEIQNTEGKWFYRRIVPYRTHDNRILGVVMIFDDVTVQKESAIESVSALVKIYELPALLIMVTDQKNRVVNVSSGWEKLLGYSKKDLEGNLVFSFIHPEDKAKTREKAKEVKNGIHLSGFKNRIRCKDGSFKTLLWTSSIDNETGYTYSSAQNIT